MLNRQRELTLAAPHCDSHRHQLRVVLTLQFGVAAMQKCINFLGDADSTASICCQLAGALYGAESIDGFAVRQVQRWDNGDIALRAMLLHHIGSQDAKGPTTQMGEMLPPELVSIITWLAWRRLTQFGLFFVCLFS